MADQPTTPGSDDLAREVTERKRAEEALSFLASILRRGLELPAVLTAIAETAGQLFQAEAGFRIVEGDELVRAACTPGARAVMSRDRMRIGESLSGRVAQSGEPIVSSDVASDPRILPEHRGGARADGLGALMCVPVRVGSRTVGTISIYRGRNAPFDADALGRAMSLADYAGIAIENARLYGEAERRRREAEELTQLARSLTESLDTTAVGRRIVDAVMSLFGAKGSGLRLLNPDGSLRGLAWGGPIMWNREPRSDVLPAKVGIMGLAVSQRAPAWSSDVTSDPALIFADEQRERINRVGLRAMLAVPLIVNNQVIGGLMVADRVGRRFTEREVALLQAFANQAALALENARLYEEARASDRAKSEFLASMSHELRTPLNSIIGFSKVLLNATHGTLNEQQENYVRTVHKSSTFLLDLINTILEFSRIEAGKVETRFDDVDVTDLVTECTDSAAPLLAEKSLALEVETAADVGSIRADRVKIKQILVNLLGNAIKFTDSGRVVVRAQHEDDQLHLTVSDTGIGIPAAELPRLFEPFHRVSDRRAPAVGGTGLGLAICKKFVDLHHGKIWVDSQHGHGSTFHVLLPRTQ